MSASPSDHDQESRRTPLVLAIKTLATHAFALASYAYVSNQLRRPTRSHIQALRIFFFAFVPTLPLVEFIFSGTRSLLQFLSNYEDSDEIPIRYYIAGGLGVHASRSQDDNNMEVAKDRSKNLHLLNVGSSFAEPHFQPVDWVYAGKLLACLFGLTQAVGTIVMWVRRLVFSEAGVLAFDNRNGAMGIASAICNIICILTILLRLNWKVAKSFTVQQKENSFTSQRRQFAVEALLSMLLHLLIMTAVDEDNILLYTSVGSVTWLFFLLFGAFHEIWQLVLLFIFFFIFRKDIARRLNSTLDTSRLGNWLKTLVGGKRWRRARVLLGFLLTVWVLVDLVWVFVVDVIGALRPSKSEDYWWQDPISDSILVI